MSEGKVKKYANDEITVIWKPALCIHSGECVQNSPKVFHPSDRPWITPDKSDSEQIMKTIDKCPSGALSYRHNDKNLDELTEQNKNDKIKIEAMKDGPFIIPAKGVEVFDSDGEIRKTKGKSIALCRCGASGNKPFCDGSHSSTDFKG